VKVQVEHGLPGGPACVGDKSKVSAQLFLSRDLRHLDQQVTHRGFIARCKLTAGSDMAVGHDQDVNWSARMGITKRRNPFVSINDLRWSLSGNNVAKDAMCRHVVTYSSWSAQTTDDLPSDSKVEFKGCGDWAYAGQLTAPMP
jgi:hypothetical protein